MKKKYSTLPNSMSNIPLYGFSWMDFLTAIPSPIFLVTSYKSNGLPNASLQSWASFSGNEHGFYAIMSNVNKFGHMYQTIKETAVAVINFPSIDIYNKCYSTILHNGYDEDEISLSGLTIGKASHVNAPMVTECFLHLECEFLWEKELHENASNIVLCLKVVNIIVDENYLDESVQGRYGQHGYIYNIHYPVNPENFSGTSHDWIGIIKKQRDMGEY